MSSKLSDQQKNNPARSYRFLPYITAIYGFLFILPSILLKKIVLLPVIGITPISILFTGTYFVILDVVAEVYGYYEARKILFAGLLVYTMFVFTMEGIVHINSPQNYHVVWSSVQDPTAYTYLFSNLYLVWISVAICTLFANSLNIIILSKWKILLRGRYFWMRSLTTSFFAALLYSFLSNLFAFGLFMSFSQIPFFLKLLLISMSAKFITLIICVYPAVILCNFLKKAEGVDVYNYGISFNPFAR